MHVVCLSFYNETGKCQQSDKKEKTDRDQEEEDLQERIGVRNVVHLADNS